MNRPRHPRTIVTRPLRVALVGLLFACSGSGGSTGLDDDDNNNGGSPGPSSSLNFFEQELVGLWSRYHAYDGSMMYWRFNANRTACKWEEASGSSSRIKVGNYSRWSIDAGDASLGSSRYRVMVTGSGLTNGLTYDYAGDRLWPTGFSNLIYTPSGSGKTC